MERGGTGPPESGGSGRRRHDFPVAPAVPWPQSGYRHGSGPLRTRPRDHGEDHLQQVRIDDGHAAGRAGWRGDAAHLFGHRAYSRPAEAIGAAASGGRWRPPLAGSAQAAETMLEVPALTGLPKTLSSSASAGCRGYAGPTDRPAGRLQNVPGAWSLPDRPVLCASIDEHRRARDRAERRMFAAAGWGCPYGYGHPGC